LKIITEYLTSNGAMLRPSDPLIRKEDGSGEALSYYVINREVTRWTKRHLGLRLTPHKLRHAYGRQCVDLGVDIRIIRSAWTRVFGVDQGLHAGVVPAHPADRRVIWLPRGLNNPMNIGEKIQLLHEGRNFQK